MNAVHMLESKKIHNRETRIPTAAMPPSLSNTGNWMLRRSGAAISRRDDNTGSQVISPALWLLSNARRRFPLVCIFQIALDKKRIPMFPDGFPLR